MIRKTRPRLGFTAFMLEEMSDGGGRGEDCWTVELV